MCLSSDDPEFLGFFIEQFTNTTLVTVKVKEVIPGQTYLRELSGEEKKGEKRNKCVVFARDLLQ